MKPQSWVFLARNCVALLFFALCCSLVQAEPDQAINRIKRAEYIISDSPVIPPAWADWRAIDLPHHVSKPTDHELVNYWYKASFEVNNLADPLWILFPQLLSGGDVYVNGSLVGEKPWANERLQVRWYVPELWLIPPVALHEGSNEIEVRLAIREPFTSFGEIDIGPEKLQRHMYDQLLFWEDTTADISTALCLLTGVFIMVFWARRPQERLYGLFGVCVLFWGLRTLLLRTPLVPIEFFMMWRLAYYFATAGFIVLISIFMLKFSERSNVIYNRVLIAYWLIGCAAFLIFGMPIRHFLEAFWLTGFLPLNLYAVACILIYAAHQRTRNAVSMGLAILFALALSVHDLAVQEAWVDWPEIYLMHLGIPAFLLVMVGILLVRFLDTLAQVESVNEQLEMRVAAREKDLKHSYDQLRKLERSHAATEERHRILQDMHDGVGSQLLSTLMMAQHAELPQKTLVGLLQECLDDMRLVIDSLTPDDRDILPVLGNFRFRMESRFRAIGLQFEWTNFDMPDALELEPDIGLNIMRILQETLANILKHAQAKQVVVEIFFRRQSLRVRIVDDGIGFNEVNPTKGRGVNNMLSRSQKIGATFKIIRLPQGTEVNLEIPIAGPNNKNESDTPASLLINQ
jgi:signal transduction histidine kinase